MHTLSSGSEHTLTHTFCFGAAEETQDLYSRHLSSCAPQTQTTLSSAVGLTMPQPNQNSLIHVLLLWTTILSIVQAMFIILFFTAGHRGLSQNNSTVARQSQTNNTPLSPPSDPEPLLGAMITYKAKQDNGKIEWLAKGPINSLVSDYGKDLAIYKDGYYFLNLQVTLKTGHECPCNEKTCPVSVKWSNADILQGWINANTCSTGLMGKVALLVGGGTLVFTIQLPNTVTAEIDDTESLTYLNIIYMSQPSDAVLMP